MKRILFYFCCIFIFKSAFAENYPIPQNTEKITYIDKTFQTYDGLTLHGHLALPSGLPHSNEAQAETVRRINQLPSVLLLVGAGPINRYENFPPGATSNGKSVLFFKELETDLVHKGIAVFTYDKRGVIPTDNTFLDNEPVTQDYQNINATNMAQDAIQAYKTLKNFSITIHDQTVKIDPSRVSLIGHSEGTILALKVAEQESEIRSLFMLSMYTRSRKDITDFQFFNPSMRLFHLVDVNEEGNITEEKYNFFLAMDKFMQGSTTLPTWEELLKQMSYSSRVDVSELEWSETLQHQIDDFNTAVYNGTLPWENGGMPSLWYQEYYNEGSHLKRFLPFCSKMHVYHGKVDAKLPFEDAVQMREQCAKINTPLLSFSAYDDLGHGFSPRIGYKQWKDTAGPMDPQFFAEIVNAVTTDLLQ